jgi:intracellular sulfur oxidation DsrE/DsrF family protein
MGMNQLACIVALVVAAPAMGAAPVISNGPVFKDFGPVADVQANFQIPPGTVFKVIYDTAEGSDAGQLNNTLVTLARFMNMHARAGVPVDDMKLVVTMHGQALLDISSAQRYARGKGEGKVNANAPLVAALLAKGVRIIACGQSLAMRDVAKEDLLPGVELALSAMTVHGILQTQGYTLNPF